MDGARGVHRVPLCCLYLLVLRPAKGWPLLRLLILFLRAAARRRPILVRVRAKSELPASTAATAAAA